MYSQYTVFTSEGRICRPNTQFPSMRKDSVFPVHSFHQWGKICLPNTQFPPIYTVSTNKGRYVFPIYSFHQWGKICLPNTQCPPMMEEYDFLMQCSHQWEANMYIFPPHNFHQWGMMCLPLPVVSASIFQIDSSIFLTIILNVAVCYGSLKVSGSKGYNNY